MEDRRANLEAAQRELLTVNERIAELSKALAELESSLEDYTTEKDRLSKELEECQTKEKDAQEAVEEAAQADGEACEPAERIPGWVRSSERWVLVAMAISTVLSAIGGFSYSCSIERYRYWWR